MNINDKIHGFLVKGSQKLDEIGAVMWRMEYEKNGAELVWLERNDENKTFSIAFKTIPSDDTGVFHILEHSVLCGSKKYPVKEPFVELIKGSMATFLNAFTFPDKTMYPISSRNTQDFLNLTDVYMDAVFHPLSIYDPNAFRQEGWHYETNGDTLSCNGVVYNEMKGAYASPDSVLTSELNKRLFPDNCYGFESGGHPDHITELTYENYLENHRRFYHPSNAKIILDGAMDIEVVLAKLDEFLVEYDMLKTDTSIPMQKPVSPEESVVSYEIGADEDDKNRCILADGWVFGDYSDNEKNLAFSVLSEALAGSNESPLPKALLDKDLAEDVELGKMDGIQQIFAYLIVRNCNFDNKSDIRQELNNVIEAIAENGLDHDQLRSILSRMEFATREKEFGDMPRGLVYAISMLESWLYDGDPAQNLCFNEVFASLRRKIDEGWFEEFLREVFIDNKHHAEVCLLPSKTLGEEKRIAEQKRLEDIQKKLSEQELAEIKEQFEALRKNQERADTAEQLACLPRLSVKDIPLNGETVPQEIIDLEGVKLLYQPLDTNGITYLNMYFSLADFNDEELRMAVIVSSLLTECGTDRHSPIELRSLLQENFGRFRLESTAVCRCEDTVKTIPYVIVKIALLKQNMTRSAEIVDEVLNNTDLSDTNLIYNIIRQSKTMLEQSIAMSGNRFAVTRAAASTSEYGAVKETMTGISFLRYLQKLEKDFDSIKDEYCASLKKLADKMFTKKRLIVGYSGELDKSWLGGIVNVLKQGEVIVPVKHKIFDKLNEGFEIPAEIAFAAKSANLYQINAEYTGVSKLAAQLMTFDYLWNEVRVKGGAYGTGMKVEPSGNVSFTSYRDPNPRNTIECIDKIGSALRSFCDNNGDLEKYIISTIAAIEPLMTPRLAGMQAELLYITGRSYASLQKIRTEILSTTMQELYAFSEVIDKLLEKSTICIVGGGSLLKNCEGLLDKTETISLSADE